MLLHHNVYLVSIIHATRQDSALDFFTPSQLLHRVSNKSGTNGHDRQFSMFGRHVAVLTSVADSAPELPDDGQNEDY